MVKYVVCDTGGSKTLLECLDESGLVCGKYFAAGFGKSVDDLCEIPELSRILEKIENPANVKSVVVNLGGKNKTQLYRAFSKVFVNADISVFRESEGEASKALSEIYGSEIVVLAGTGTIACGFSDGATAVCGGWGMNIGDGGSGYYIGLEAIKRSLTELDGRRPLSLLCQAVTGESKPINEKAVCEIAKTRDHVREKILPLTREGVARYAKTVLECAEKGDAKSVEILEAAGVELGELAVKTAEKLNLDELNGVVFTGGVINSKKFIEGKITEKIKERYGDVKITYLTNGIVEGLEYIAKNKNSEGEKTYVS